MLNQHLPSPVTYREDINGLRAWAVVAVLLFHFSLIGLPGGFIGVDIFFVISGYLMTAIVVSKLEKGSFSLLDFYMARVRRILPALLVVITTLLILGWFWLPTPDYQELGKQSAYSLAFLSNIGYWKSAGYFDSAAHEKWLLHTWSLAVEAQFYVIYPILVATLWKLWPKIKILTVVLTALFVLSFTLNITLVHYKPTAAFYLLPTRGWELLAGGLVYLLSRQLVLSKPNTNVLYWLGWVLVFSSLVFITQHLAWPGHWAILPVLGTSFIMFANNQDCKLTNNAIAQWLGDRSYSLYLWHWPLVVALVFTSLQTDWLWVSMAFILSLALAHISYHFVETPTRQYLTHTKLFQEVLVITATTSVILIIAISIKFISFNGRIPIEIEMVTNETLNKDPRINECFKEASATSPGCIYPSNSKQEEPTAILIGDSHAAASVTALAEASSKNSKSIVFFGKQGCATVRGLHRTNNNCYDFNNWLLNEKIPSIKHNIPIVIINRSNVYVMGHNEQEATQIAFFNKPVKQLGNVEFLENFKNSLIDTACELQQKRQVYLVRPTPEMKIDIPKFLSRNMILNNENDDIKISLAEYYARNKLVWEAQDKAVQKCGVKILNPLPYLCDDLYCYGSKNGRPLYYDDDHLSEYGNKYLVPMFESIF